MKQDNNHKFDLVVESFTYASFLLMILGSIFGSVMFLGTSLFRGGWQWHVMLLGLFLVCVGLVIGIVGVLWWHFFAKYLQVKKNWVDIVSKIIGLLIGLSTFAMIAWNTNL